MIWPTNSVTLIFDFFAGFFALPAEVGPDGDTGTGTVTVGAVAGTVAGALAGADVGAVVGAVAVTVPDAFEVGAPPVVATGVPGCAAAQMAVANAMANAKPVDITIPVRVWVITRGNIR